MMGDYQVRFCERFGVRFPLPTRPAVPMAGYSDPNIVSKVKHIPFWIFHGGADVINPVQGSRNMFKLLTDAGATVKYTELEGFEHSPAFKEAWKDSTIIPWIFAQQKTD